MNLAVNLDGLPPKVAPSSAGLLVNVTQWLVSFGIMAAAQVFYYCDILPKGTDNRSEGYFISDIIERIKLAL
jgi:hypothetical protein